MTAHSRVLTLLSLSLFLGTTLSDAAPSPTRLGLGDLYRSTVESSESVQTKDQERLQVLEVKNQGVGALFPQISGVGTYTKTDIPAASLSTSSLSSADTQKVLKLTGKQYLFKGGSEYAFLAKTNRTLEAREAELEQTRQRYYLELSSAYYDALLKQSIVTHAKTELGLYDEQISELRGRVKIGRTRSSELLSVQALRAGSEAQLRAAESDLAASKITLANLARVSSEFELVEETPESSKLEPLEHYLKLSEQRPDLVAARKRRDAAAEDVNFQRDGHFPTVDVSGNYYLRREGVSNRDSKWDATLTLTLPIFSGGTTQASVRQYASILKTNEIETGRLERTAENDIRSLYQNLLASDAELKAFADAVDLATKSYNLSRKDYRFGLTTNLDLLNALKTLTSAKRSLDQARYRHFLERIQLEIGSGIIPKTVRT